MCCSKCFERICSKSVSAGKLWLNLCEIQAAFCKRPLTSDEESKELKILESLGFITTTDTIPHIIVKINGQQEDEEGIFFCIGNCNDQESLH